MKQKHEIIDECCKPYGGFVNVITKCGGTLVSRVWAKSMELYADQFRQAAVNRMDCELHDCKKICPQCENDTFPM